MHTIVADVATAQQTTFNIANLPNQANRAGYRNPTAQQSNGSRANAGHRPPSTGEREPRRGNRFILAGKSPRLFSDDIAIKLGPIESLILTQINYRLCEGNNIRDGKPWAYNTYEGWQEEFPYLSVSKIRRVFTKLRDTKLRDSDQEGLLIATDVYNRRHNDRTLWYTINVEVFTAMFGEPPSFVREAKVTVQNEQLLSDVGAHFGQLHTQSSRTLDNSTEKVTAQNEHLLPKRTTKRSTKTKRSTNHPRARNEDLPASTLDGWLVGSPNGANEFISTSTDPENETAANRTDAAFPPLQIPPPDAAVLMTAAGIAPAVAALLARKEGCTVAKVERVIDGWELGRKSGDFRNPLGALRHRLENLEQFCGADKPQRIYDAGDLSNPDGYVARVEPLIALTGGPEASDIAAAEVAENLTPIGSIPATESQAHPLPQLAAAAIAGDVGNTDPLIAHWPEICKAELSNVPELSADDARGRIQSRLVARDDGGYQVAIANACDLERVQLAQRAIRMALGGRPFEVVAGGSNGITI